jgi:uncharacterized protein
VKALHVVSLILVIVGALNWGLVGLFDFNLVSALFGQETAFTNLIYVLVGLAGLAVIFTDPWRASVESRTTKRTAP